MNGKIEVSSKKGKGTDFVVTITLEDCKKKNHSEKAGIKAESALSGEKAVEMAKSRYKDNEPYNLIILDWKMPGMDNLETSRLIRSSTYDAILMDMRMPVMDGLEATTEIRKINGDYAKNIPIIALTANAFEEDIQRRLQAGLNAHLSKPVQPDLLFETLESML